jgi:hypothetical protein
MTSLIRPYQEAYDYQRKRTPLVPADYHALDERWRPQAITVAGLERYDLVAAVDRICERGLAENMTMSEVVDELGKIIDEQDGLILSASRLELIQWNAMMTATAAASYRQAMEFVEDRPIFCYYGPDDGPNHTISPVCRPIHKMKVRYDDPILKHMWGPNHHHEYHEWMSMTLKEAGDDIYVSDGEYPVIDGAEVRPAAGFDFNPAESMVDDGAFAQGVASLKGIANRKATADYGLVPLQDLASGELPKAPAIGKAIGATPKAAAAAWTKYRAALGIEAGDGAWLADYAGDGVRVNKASFDELIGADRENARYLSFVEPALAAPTETWWVAYETDEGTAYAKRYIAVFDAGKGKRITVVMDTTPAGIAAGDGRTPGAWLWRMKVTDKPEDFRKGLLAHSRAPRSR